MPRPLSRLRERVEAVPLPRLRRILLGLYLAVAFADAAGKALAANPAVSDAVMRRLRGAAAAEMRDARRPSGNFEIFRASSRHLVTGEDLYAQYETEQDKFKYSPSFALLFSPFSWIPWPIALFLWSALNGVGLFLAVERVLPQRQALFAMGLLLLEVLRTIQNAQSNALVAAIIIAVFAATERGRPWRAAALVALGACIKIFPLAALTFAIPVRRAVRTGLCAAAAGAGVLLLPLLVTPPATLMRQYASWQAVEAVDAGMRWFSVMELLHRWTAGLVVRSWPVQLAGVLLLLLPLALRRARWAEPRFRLLYLCSVLLFVVLFNHQAERASYVIAVAGATIWFVSSPRTRWRTTLFALAMLTIPVMSTLVPGAWLKLPTVVLYRLVLPTLLIWAAVQVELWGPREPGVRN
jgi:hypothetical protein